VQVKNAPSTRVRIQSSLNICKYFSSLPGLWLPLLMAPYATTRRIEQVLMWVLLFNSMFSFCWDVFMDWGLGQAGGLYWGLRPTLLFGTAWQYYLAIVADFFLRIVWVLKYVEFDHMISYDRFMLLIEVLEVVRRSMWAIFRIEWECLNRSHIQAKLERPNGASHVV
jgi:glycerol-3-phosphate acyltransferase PlsY